MKQLYRILLQLYPHDYRSVFGSEMRDAFDCIAEELARQSWRKSIWFLVSELVGLFSGALREWTAKTIYGLYHTNSYIIHRCQPDPGLMWPSPKTRALHLHATELPKLVGPTTDRVELCLNAQQRFMFASPVRRLLMSVCSSVLPIHTRTCNDDRGYHY